MRIGMIGVGNVGSALGARFVASGHEVVFGVRPGRDVGALLEECGDRAAAASPGEAMARGEVVFLAVPGEAAVAALDGLDVAGKVIVDCNNPLSWDDGPAWAPPEEGSITAQLARAYPEGRFVKGFSTFGTELHRDPDLGGRPVDVHLASDDPEAKKGVAEIARSAGFRPVDAGPLRNAALLENLAVLWIHLGMVGPHGREFAFLIVDRA